MILELYLPELISTPSPRKPKPVTRRERQEELLKMFPNSPCYWEIYKDGKWYVKQFNGNTRRWQVAIYTPESFSKYREYADKQRDLHRQIKNN